MSETWYRLTSFGETEPTPVKVESHTSKFVQRVGVRGRDAITTTWQCFRKTKRECLQWLVDARRAELDAANGSIKAAQDNASRIDTELAKAISALGDCDD